MLEMWKLVRLRKRVCPRHLHKNRLRKSTQAAVIRRKKNSPPPFSFSGLQDAMINKLHAHSGQMKILEKWWCAVGFEPEPKGDLMEVVVEGDSSAVEFSICVACGSVSSMLPGLLHVLPNAKPSPPPEEEKQPPLQPVVVDAGSHCAPPPPDDLDTWVFPDKEQVVKADEQQVEPTDVCLVPTLVGQQARGKAKARTKTVSNPSLDHLEAQPGVPAVQRMGEGEKGRLDIVFSPVVSQETSFSKEAEPLSFKQSYSVRRDLDQPAVDFEQAASLWRSALERACKKLMPVRATVWLRLSDITMPVRTADIGVRFHTPDQKPANFELVNAYDDVSSCLKRTGITPEAGWAIRSVGCSFFMHGPLVLFNLSTTKSVHEYYDMLFRKMVPPSVMQSAVGLCIEDGIEISVQADVVWGKVRVGLRFELVQDHREKDLEQLGFSLGEDPNQVFDGMFMKDVVQLLQDAGCKVKIIAVECCGKKPARVTLSVVA